jgi:hypothetical protein
MKINREYKKKFLDTYDMWVWLAETGKKKSDYPKYIDKILNIKVQCGFCDYILNKNDGDCAGCPLQIDYLKTCCDGLYRDWTTAKYESKEKKGYAKQIKDKIEKFLKEEGILKCK